MERDISERLLRIAAFGAAVEACTPGNSLLVDTAKFESALNHLAQAIVEEAEAAFGEIEAQKLAQSSARG